MLISAHEQNNGFYYLGGTPWMYAWTSQKLVSAAQVTATGGTYELTAPEVAEDSPKRKPGRPKKS